jgi:hypothetical protein
MANIKRPSDYLMAQDLYDRQNCYRATFATFTGRAGQPMDFDGDFDDHFTAEDYDRRRYQRDARQYGYGR